MLGDRRWGCLRFVLVMASIAIFTGYAHWAYGSESIKHLVQTWIDRQGALRIIPRVFLEFIGLFILGRRFLWLSLAALFSAMWVGASYLQVIFDIPSIWQTFRYLGASLFGLGYPGVTIDEGRLQVEAGVPNLIRDIGGPGWVVVQPGNVVLTEYTHKPARVQADGAHFLSRFETVKRFRSDFEADGWEIITVDDRHGVLEKVETTTKDGITIIVEDIRFRYRLRLGRAFGDYVKRDPKNPNRFSVEAVKDMAYNRTARVKPRTSGEIELTPWHNMISFAVDGAITDYIRERRFNDIVHPDYPQAPRQVITDKLFSRGVRNRLRSNGAELLWWDIGHFKIEDRRVADQLVENWGLVWEGGAKVRRAFGEAKRIEQMERGRAEAQAEMLLEIMNAFDDMDLLENNQENVVNLLLARTAQILEGMKDNLNESPQGPTLPPIVDL